MKKKNNVSGLQSIHPSTDLDKVKDKNTKSSDPYLSKKELHGWYMFDWANSAFSSAAISGFLSLALQETALQNSGFPEICPNVITDSSLVHEYFPNKTMMYFLKSAKLLTDCIQMNNTQYCSGTPSASYCLKTDGISTFPLRATIGSLSVDPNSYFSISMTASKIVQLIFYICLGSMADYGSLRYSCLLFFTLFGSIVSLLLPLMNSASWWLGGIITVVSTLCFGLSLVFYNSYLPVLSQSHPRVRDAMKEDKEPINTKIQDEMSGTGFIMGYISGVLILILCVPIVYFFSVSGYIWSCSLSGLWWLLFSIPTFLYLKKRPGPDLPKGEHYITYNFKRYGSSLKKMILLPNALKMLLAWFLYSDCFNTIGSLAVQLANIYINWGSLNKSIGLVILMIESPLAAGIGTWFFLLITRKNLIHAKKIIYICVIGNLIICIYASLMTIPSLFPYLNAYYYLFILCFIYGFFLGPVQSYSRSLFSTMIPAGHESEFFAIYEVTDKGSSWIGPLAISLCSTYLNNMLYAFYIEIIMIILSLIVLLFVDTKKAKREVKLFEATEKTITTVKFANEVKEKVDIVIDKVKGMTTN
ncbi:hypothetical protein WA158_001556 [Blastocystis sp. Blastoise]